MAKNISKGKIVNMLEEKAAFFNFRVWVKQNWKVVLVLVLLVCAAYWNSLGADFTSDDTRSILNNESLDKTSYVLGQNRINPIIHFFINKIFGRVPIYYRLVNIIAHAAVVLTTYLLFSILIGPKVAFFTAAILAVHPIETESVTWISGGPYALYTFFIVLALLLYTLSYKNKKLLKFSFIVFIISLFTHDMAVAFPLVLFAFILSFSDLRKNWKDLIPFFTAVIIIFLLYMGKIGQRLETFQADFYQESHIMNPFVQIPIAITSYLGLIFWPKVLTLYHSELIFSLTQYFIRLALFIIFLGVVIYSF
ncbi:MAG: glycosyltransferase family 39 protein, partial [Candidatus Omnitrophica bacterium]|nr:glycosyltransferase family 39 protein [Candidatus Omnitrophota bacterium]